MSVVGDLSLHRRHRRQPGIARAHHDLRGASAGARQPVDEAGERDSRQISGWPARRGSAAGDQAGQGRSSSPRTFRRACTTFQRPRRSQARRARSHSFERLNEKVRITGAAVSPDGRWVALRSNSTLLFTRRRFRQGRRARPRRSHGASKSRRAKVWRSDRPASCISSARAAARTPRECSRAIHCAFFQ